MNVNNTFPIISNANLQTRSRQIAKDCGYWYREQYYTNRIPSFLVNLHTLRLAQHCMKDGCYSQSVMLGWDSSLAQCENPIFTGHKLVMADVDFVFTGSLCQTCQSIFKKNSLSISVSAKFSFLFSAVTAGDVKH